MPAMIDSVCTQTAFWTI